KIVNASPKDRDLLFVPDENLGAWVMEQTGQPMTLWRGNCYAHVEFRRDNMIAYCKSNLAKRFVMVTESGSIHRLKNECPDKEFFCAPVFDVMKMPKD